MKKIFSYWYSKAILILLAIVGIGLFDFYITERRKIDKMKKALDTLDTDSFYKIEEVYGPPPTEYHDKDSVNRILDTLENDNDVEYIRTKQTAK
ncbi:MAG: hypothetical protein IJV06_02185 [Bacteroidaceae bacterium]|nr:hypothetical protein [Bacteroidaceae bacterium]